MRKFGAKVAPAPATATCRQHQLSIGFRPSLWRGGNDPGGADQAQARVYVGVLLLLGKAWETSTGSSSLPGLLRAPTESSGYHSGSCRAPGTLVSDAGLSAALPFLVTGL